MASYDICFKFYFTGSFFKKNFQREFVKILLPFRNTYKWLSVACAFSLCSI